MFHGFLRREPAIRVAGTVMMTCWKRFGPGMVNKILVVQLASTRGHCLTFNSTIPPLQVAPSFACSVASLSLCLGFQLPGRHGLHHVILADYLLGWGRVSTCLTGHDELHYTSMTNLKSHRRNFQQRLMKSDCV